MYGESIDGKQLNYTQGENRVIIQGSYRKCGGNVDVSSSRPRAPGSNGDKATPIVVEKFEIFLRNHNQEVICHFYLVEQPFIENSVMEDLLKEQIPPDEDRTLRNVPTGDIPILRKPA